MSSAPNDAVSGECLPLFLLDNDPQALAHIRSVAESVIRRDALALCVHAFTDLQAVEAAIVNANTHCLCLFDILMDEDEPGGMELARRLRARKLDVGYRLYHLQPGLRHRGLRGLCRGLSAQARQSG